MEVENTQTQTNPLVSIIVITYNNAKFVLETLESAKAQTYNNIELIVSDDYSSDGTLEICREWIEENKERFVRTELVEVEKNTGIPENCNRGVKASQGEWVCLIAGDDVMFYSSVEIAISSLSEGTKILVSEVMEFATLDKLDLNERLLGNTINKKFLVCDSAEKQFVYFLNGFYVSGASVFIYRDSLLKLNGFDETYSLVEDIPLFLKYTFSGIMIKYISEISLGHRRHSEALTARSEKKIVPQYLVQVYKAIYAYSNLYKNIRFKVNASWHNFMFWLIIRFGNKGLICQYLDKMRLTFQPIRFYNLLKKLKIV